MSNHRIEPITHAEAHTKALQTIGKELSDINITLFQMLKIIIANQEETEP